MIKIAFELHFFLELYLCHICFFGPSFKLSSYLSKHFSISFSECTFAFVAFDDALVALDRRRKQERCFIILHCQIVINTSVFRIDELDAYVRGRCRRKNHQTHSCSTENAYKHTSDKLFDPFPP